MRQQRPTSPHFDSPSFELLLYEAASTPLHLQEIHHHVYQDLYDWAGELRRVDAGNRPASEVATSLNAIFDRLGRENHLKGRSPEDWSHSASTYIYDLARSSRFSPAMKLLSVNLPKNWLARTISVFDGKRRSEINVTGRNETPPSVRTICKHPTHDYVGDGYRPELAAAKSRQIMERGIETFFPTGTLLL